MGRVKSKDKADKRFKAGRQCGPQSGQCTQAGQAKAGRQAGCERYGYISAGGDTRTYQCKADIKALTVHPPLPHIPGRMGANRTLAGMTCTLGNAKGNACSPFAGCERHWQRGAKACLCHGSMPALSTHALAANLGYKTDRLSVQVCGHFVKCSRTFSAGLHLSI